MRAVATPNTRATDDDRNDTCQVLDTALSEGQLSMEEHRERVSAATSATTLGDLQSLVSDLQVHRVPAQLQKLKSPGGGWGMRIAVAAVLVLLGVGIAWGLFGNKSSPSMSPFTRGTTTSSRTTTSAPPQAQQDLLSLGGLTGFLAQMRKQFGDTMGYELTVWSQRAALFRPDSANPHKTVNWAYTVDPQIPAAQRGMWMNTGDWPMPPDTALGDLSKFNVQEVLGVVRAAPQTLNVSNPTETYLIIDSANDGSLALAIHVSDGTNSGYLDLAADGTVGQIHPADS
ncbi:MAG: DUF1707 domain-containing protein [Mycobacteriaceae bacterium]|nr:DUF1707 domain-containing protein [Mycobacteriaceae bacterium]